MPREANEFQTNYYISHVSGAGKINSKIITKIYPAQEGPEALVEAATTMVGAGVSERVPGSTRTA
jgi:hypothetical protein